MAAVDRVPEAGDDPAPPAESLQACRTAPPCWTSDRLLQGHPVVLIEHRGATYQLRLTRQDKLILTK